MINVNENKNEETMTEKEMEEVFEAVTGMVHMGASYFKSINTRWYNRGFVVGLLTATAIQSIVTILILMKG